MIKKLAIVGMVLVALVVTLTAYSFLRPPAEASALIEAIPVELDEPADGTGATEEDVTDAEAEEAEIEVLAPEGGGEPIVEPAAVEAIEEEISATVAEPAAVEEEPAVEAETEDTSSLAEATEPIIFEIEQGGSQARYLIDEVLRGAPVTVVGVTDQVAGQIAVNLSDPSSTQLGTILINARTFATDEGRRDNAVQNRILFTEQYEYITFEPTSLVGLPTSATVGESYSFQIVGNLTIRDTTHEVIWDATVTPVSESQLEGSASTTINRSDWNLTIPDVPFVADVSEQVRLELDFVATAQ